MRWLRCFYRMRWVISWMLFCVLCRLDGRFCREVVGMGYQGNVMGWRGGLLILVCLSGSNKTIFIDSIAQFLYNQQASIKLSNKKRKEASVHVRKRSVKQADD